ncbi:hypothetical protein [Carboxylicivirga marina]|uniref:Cardiolipin synthase N-terminal domain-containing protein n=1 Tax=Carboxylicivirga marina TaxID=2800988 RepID=A0ABS1HQG5_9BACT|nr:hypothetical protein [Carboxylicivirga marina]MBK3519886.1 hypothetical protein [Carboxylicivirga marina]
MEQTGVQANPILSFLPLLLIMIPLIFVIRKLAIEKGRDAVLWTILACIPFVNFIVLWYIVGTPNKRLEDKMDKILEALNKSDKE